MKSAIVNFLKFMLCFVLYGGVYMLAMGLMPFSHTFTEASQQLIENPAIASSLLMLLPIFWSCFTAYFIIRHANIGGKKLFIRLLYVMFFAMHFMPQVSAAETAGIHGAIWWDFMLITIPGLLALLTMIPLLIIFFQNQNTTKPTDESNKFNIKDTIIKLGIGGLVFAGTYIIFLLTVQRHFEEYRVFYADTAWMQAAHGENLVGLFPLFLIPFFRGVTNGFFVLPLLSVITKNKLVFIIAICLVILSQGIMLVAPNPLLPDTVRLLLMSSIFLTGLISSIFIGNVLCGKRGEHITKVNT